MSLNFNIFSFVFAVLAGILGFASVIIISINYKHYVASVKKNALYFMLALALFSAALLMHSLHIFTANEAYDSIAHLAEVLAFSIVSVSSLAALKVAKEYGFGAGILGLMSGLAAAEATHIFLVTAGFISAALSFYAWRKFAKDNWGAIYFQSFLFRILLTIGYSLSLGEHFSGNANWEISGNFIILMAFVLILFTAIKLKTMTENVVVAAVNIKQQ